MFLTLFFTNPYGIELEPWQNYGQENLLQFSHFLSLYFKDICCRLYTGKHSNWFLYQIFICIWPATPPPPQSMSLTIVAVHSHSFLTNLEPGFFVARIPIEKENSTSNRFKFVKNNSQSPSESKEYKIIKWNSKH